MTRSKTSNRYGAHAAKAGGAAGFSNLSLPTMVAEFRGRAIAAFNALPDREQEKEIGRATSFAGKALKAELSFTSMEEALATKRRTDAACATDATGSVWVVETGDSHVDDNEAVLVAESSLGRGEALAYNLLRRWAGAEEGIAFYRGLKARGTRLKDREAEMFKEAYRHSLTYDVKLWAASKGPDRSLTAAQAIAQGAHLGLLGKHLGASAAAKAAAEAEVKAAADALAASLAASAAECERKARMKWRWQQMFQSLIRLAARMCVSIPLEHAIDMRSATRDDYIFAKERFDRRHIRHARIPEPGAFANLDEAHQDYQFWCNEVNALELEYIGMGSFAATWCRRAAKRVASAKPKPAPRRQRITAAAREAFHVSAVRALPAYLKPVDASAYTKPVEEIASVRFGNLPLADGAKQCGQLRKAIRDFVEEHYGALAESKAGDGAIFTPLRRGATIGYAFVKFRDGASATAFLARMKDPMLVDPVTGTPSALFIERAASEHKTKAQMEAEKAAKAKGAAPPPTAVTAARERIIALMKADAKVTATAPLVPTVLGAASKAAKQAAADEAEAAMKAKIDAMFPASLPCAAVAAKEFEVSFATVASKPAVKAVEVVYDPFHTTIRGETYGIFHDRRTEIGQAQAALSAALEAEEAKAKALATKRRRAERAKRNAALPADDPWGPEADTDDEGKAPAKAPAKAQPTLSVPGFTVHAVMDMRNRPVLSYEAAYAEADDVLAALACM